MYVRLLPGLFWNIRSCIISEESGCLEDDYDTVFSDIQSTCTSYQTLGKDLCDGCYNSLITDLNCADATDFECLCGPQTKDFLADFVSCAENTSSGIYSCPAKSISIRSSIHGLNCEPFSTVQQKANGCAICQN